MADHPVERLIEAAKRLQLALDVAKSPGDYGHQFDMPRAEAGAVTAITAAEAWMKEQRSRLTSIDLLSDIEAVRIALYNDDLDGEEKREAKEAIERIKAQHFQQHSIAREALEAVREFVDGYCPEHSSQIAQELTVGTIEEIDAQLAKLED